MHRKPLRSALGALIAVVSLTTLTLAQPSFAQGVAGHQRVDHKKSDSIALSRTAAKHGRGTPKREKTAPPHPDTVAGRPVVKVLHVLATAYGPSAQDNAPYGATDFFGAPLRSGMIAVDPNVIPLKSAVYVTGYQDANLPQGGFVGSATDTGSAIQGNRIDVFMNRAPSAVSKFGMQNVVVYILGAQSARHLAAR